MSDLEFLTPIAIVVSLTTALILYVFLRTPASSLLKYVLTPAALLAAIFSGYLVIGKLGYAVAIEIPKKAFLLHYNVVFEQNERKRIELWLRDGQGEVTRLHVIPWSKEAEKKLREGVEKAKKGGALVLRRGNGFDSDKPEFETDILTPEQLFRKDGEPEEEEVEIEPRKPAKPDNSRV